MKLHMTGCLQYMIITLWMIHGTTSCVHDHYSISYGAMAASLECFYKVIIFKPRCTLVISCNDAMRMQWIREFYIYRICRGQKTSFLKLCDAP